MILQTTPQDPSQRRVRLVAVDMDGTFLDSTGRYDRERFARSHRAMMRAGIQFVVASGNQHAQLRRQFEPLDGLWYIAENGGVIAHDAQVIRCAAIPSTVVTQALALMDTLPRVLTLACGPETAYVRTHADPELLAAIRPYFVRLARVDEWSRLGPVVKVALSCAPEATATLLDLLAERLPAGLVAVSSGHGSIDLIAAGVNKGTALGWLTHRLGVELAETVAFGDGGNDLELLSMAGLGVAMANAPAAVKARADDVAASNDEAGVLAYLDGLQVTSTGELWPLPARQGPALAHPGLD